jgi:hypothetical protein
MKMFNIANRSAILGLRKKLFTELKYIVICGIAHDLSATFYHHGILSKY